ncbi:MAG: NACHT domain-containing protein [Elainellaceae cyanobacterium]
MPKKDYDWKRFWCPRSGNINLACGGYLCDPDWEWGKAYNPDLVSSEAIADVPCLVLLGEPGIGKSRELEKLKDLTEKEICKSSQVLELNLRSCTNLKEDLFKDETFTDWLGNSHHLYLFLDSLDEGLLSIPTLATGLIDELKKPKYQNHVNRLHLRLACRTFVFPAILEEGLKELWKEDCFRVYELAPLRRIDVVEAAEVENFSPDNFLKEIDQKDVVPLAIKPITLGFLLNTYRRHSGQFPLDQRLHELYLEGCKLLCEEVNESRHASSRVGSLDSDQRLIVAARIAAVTTFANRFAVWTGVDQGHVVAEDVLLQKLCFSCEEANGREFEITREVIKEVLDTGLFSSRGLNRMGWAHQTYAEFLAAWYLTQHNLSPEQIVSLILHPDGKLIPQLHESVAWLSSMRLDVFQKVMETDPDVLLQSDLASIDEATKSRLVESLLKLYDQGKLAYQYRFKAYQHLNHSELPAQLQPYILDSTRSIDARRIAIDIAENCNVEAVQSNLVDVALDANQPYWVRTHAARAVVCIGNDETKVRLRPLAFGSESDPEDDLRGIALKALYPRHMDLEEVLNSLTQPKSNVIGGSYQGFIAQDLSQQLQVTDLPVALKWLEGQSSRRRSHYPFDELFDAILLKAWEHLEDPDILKRFIGIAISRLREFDYLVDYRENQQLKQELEENDRKRRRLIEAIINELSESESDLIWLFDYSGYSTITLLEQDFSWLIERLKSAKSKSLQQAWAKLIREEYGKYRRDDFDYINTVLIESEKNPVLKEIFSDLINAVDLDSPKAQKAKNEAQKTKERQERIAKRGEKKYLNPPPKERVLNALADFESGKIDVWPLVCQEMTLIPTSTHYNDSDLSKPDLTELPGWKEAGEDTQIRLIEAAKIYVVQGDPETDQWLTTNSYRYSALAGYKALQLLLKIKPDFISTLSIEVWEKWTPIILAYSNFGNGVEDFGYRKELIQYSYQNAYDEFIRVLPILVDKEITQNGFIRVNNLVYDCWDETIANIFLTKIRDDELKPEGMDTLLKDLLSHGVSEARTFAESLICPPFSSENNQRAKAIVAGRALMFHSDDAGWPVLWPAIQCDPEFGREVLALPVVYHLDSSGEIEQKLGEDSLADLYLFLVQQCPYTNSEEESSQLQRLDGISAHISGPEDSLKRWRDYIPQRLQERGKPEACDALQKIIRELPELKDQLHWRLLEAEALVRRKTWQPPTPEEFLQIVISQDPSNSDLSNQLETIDQRTKKMEDDPRVENNFNITDSHINAPIGNSGETHSHVTVPNSDTRTSTNAKKGINWGHLLTVVGIIASIMVSGAFNEEFRQWLNHIFSPQVKQESTPQAD